VQIDAHLFEKFRVTDAALKPGRRRGRAIAVEGGIQAPDAFVALLEHEPEQLFGPIFVDVFRGEMPLGER
jgi:hypothetical protein